MNGLIGLLIYLNSFNLNNNTFKIYLEKEKQQLLLSRYSQLNWLNNNNKIKLIKQNDSQFLMF